MTPTTAPLLTSLTTVAAGMLMLLAGLKKRRLDWRPRPVDKPRRGMRGRRQRP